MEIRDPIHGPVLLSAPETAVLDHPLVQRLRRVRQLGFAEHTFPGATHTRFLHSVGAMHLAGLAFDAVAGDLAFVPEADRRRARATLRLAALLHDLGHPPMSHGGEGLLPDARLLGVPEDRRATHEELTLALLSRGGLADATREAFAGEGVEPGHVAAVLDGDASGADPFRFGSVTVLPLLHQLIAGELDVDRMDYLHRDSYFTGVSYGHYDRDWILSHLGVLVDGGTACLAIDSNAVHAFEDFLLSRHHMFLMVYSHPRSLAYHRLLARFLDGAGRHLRLPVQPDALVRCDDEWLRSALESSDDSFARRIVGKRLPKLAVEVWDDDAHDLDGLRGSLAPSLPDGVEWVDSSVEFSRYFRKRRAPGTPALLVRVRYPGPRRTVVPIEEYTDLFGRHARGRHVVRLYCRERDAQDVAAAVAAAMGSRTDG
jgi:HD superfamily phosphohydrolase